MRAGFCDFGIREFSFRFWIPMGNQKSGFVFNQIFIFKSVTLVGVILSKLVTNIER